MAHKILVLARRDSQEAMRVAAGLTIFGHQVTLVLMQMELAAADYQGEAAELLELAEIVPVTSVAQMAEHCELLTPQSLGERLASADRVLNL